MTVSACSAGRAATNELLPATGEPVAAKTSPLAPAGGDTLFDDRVTAPRTRETAAAPRVISTASRVLYDVLAAVFTSLGFDALRDEVFLDLVIARIVEPTQVWHNVPVPDDARYIEVNGQEPSDEAIALLDHEGWGHFTAMQVRDGATRGLDLHLARLAAAHREIYGSPLDGAVVRAHIRHALDGRPDASVRVYGYWAGVIVTVRAPHDMPGRPHTMTAQHFQRPLARLKHVGSWGQGRFHDLAMAAGFDEGLLVNETGRISEGNITNVGFWRDGSVVWPAAPKLDGITMLVLQRQLRLGGIPQAEAVVRIQDLPSYQSMFLCNSAGWAPVSRVDDLSMPPVGECTEAISTAYDQCPRDRI